MKIFYAKLNNMLTNSANNASIKEIKQLLTKVLLLLDKPKMHGPITVHFAHGDPKILEYKAMHDLGG